MKRRLGAKIRTTRAKRKPAVPHRASSEKGMKRLARQVLGELGVVSLAKGKGKTRRRRAAARP